MATRATDTPRYLAKHRFAPLTARKARLAADLIRGMNVNRALETLEFSPKRSSYYLIKVLKSAVANAGQDEGVNVNQLYVAECYADDGPLRNGHVRWRAGPQGRAMPVRRRTSHLTVVVQEREAEEGKDSKRGKARREAAKKG